MPTYKKNEDVTFDATSIDHLTSDHVLIFLVGIVADTDVAEMITNQSKLDQGPVIHFYYSRKVSTSQHSSLEKLHIAIKNKRSCCLVV